MAARARAKEAGKADAIGRELAGSGRAQKLKIGTTIDIEDLTIGAQILVEMKVCRKLLEDCQRKLSAITPHANEATKAAGQG